MPVYLVVSMDAKLKGRFVVEADMWRGIIKKIYLEEQWSMWIFVLVVGGGVGGWVGVAVALIVVEGLLFVVYGKRPYRDRLRNVRGGDGGRRVDERCEVAVNEEGIRLESEWCRKMVGWEAVGEIVEQGEIVRICVGRRSGIEGYIEIRKDAGEEVSLFMEILKKYCTGKVRKSRHGGGEGEEFAWFVLLVWLAFVASLVVVPLILVALKVLCRDLIVG